MALTPIGVNSPGITRSELIKSIRQPQSYDTSRATARRVVNPNQMQNDENGTPTEGFRIRTASTDIEIETQTSRLSSLIANDNIDMNAPAGSYINLLL